MPATAVFATTDIVSLDWLRTSGVRILIIVAVAIGVSRVGTLAIRRMRRKLDASPSATGAINLRRTTTIVGFLVLGELGVNLGPLIAGAGIVGVALGFGAQSLVRDFLSGFFIVLENQFTVGDAVELTTDVSAMKVLGRIEA